METDLNTSHAIIIFDGVCSLCNWFVRFVIRHDKAGYFKFATLNSLVAEKLLAGFVKDNSIGKMPDSVMLVENRQVFVKSEAVVRIGSRLQGFKWVVFFYRLLPVCARDWLYDLVAKRRYRWFGKKDACMIPTPEIMERFI